MLRAAERPAPAGQAQGSTSTRRALTRFALASVVVAVAVGIAGAAVSRRAAQTAAGDDARTVTQVLAHSVIVPNLTDALVDGVRAAAAGQSPLDPKVARTLLTRRGGQAPQEQLSDREREVLVLVAEGLANKQIARHLGISERTVKAHLTSIFSTIGVTDRTQAALWAERNRLRGGGA